MNLICTTVRDGYRMTRDAVASFASQDIQTHTFIVLNDASDTLTCWTRSLDPLEHYSYLQLSRQHSVAACWNKALHRAFNIMQLRYVLVCNNDVILRPDTYSALIDANLPFCTGIGVDSMNQASVWDGKLSHRPHPDFSCFLIRREAWEAVGPFDENFLVAYCEDNDYHCRLHQAGITATCIGVPFYHVGAGTLKMAHPKDKQRIEEQAMKNRAYFKEKWGFSVGSPEYEAFFSAVPSGTASQP